MLRITIDLIPHGDETRKTTIADGEIWNDGSGNTAYGNYGFELTTEYSCWTGEVKGHSRAQPVWALIAQVLHNAGHRTH